MDGSFALVNLISQVRVGRKEMVYVTVHLTHFIYTYIVSDIIMVNNHQGTR